MSDNLIKYEPQAPARTKQTLSGLLESESIKKELAKIVAKHLTPDKLIKMALIAVSRQPALLECTQYSLLQAVTKAGQMGLDFSGTLGRGYLVPIWNRKVKPNVREANFWPGYLGLIDLVRNSGELLDITAEVVFKQDTFKIIKGSHPDIIHEQDPLGEMDDKDVIGAYMIAWLKDGGRHQHWENRKSIEKLRRRGKSPDDGPWITDYQAMCKKTCLRQGVKLLPMSVETQEKIAELDRGEFDISHTSRVMPEVGSLTLDDFSEKTTDPPTVDVTTEPTTEEQAGLGLQGKEEPWEQLKAEFENRVAAMGLKSKAKEQASAACRGAAGINDWIEAETPEQIAAARAWMDEYLTS